MVYVPRAAVGLRGSPDRDQRDPGALVKVKRLGTALVVVGLLASASWSTTPARADGPASSSGVIVPTHKTYPSGGTTTVGQGLQRSNSNAQLAESIPAQVRPRWGAAPSAHSCLNEDSELTTRTTATSRKYTAVLSTATCSRISVYRTSSGKKVWRKAFFEVSSIVSDGTLVYAYTEDINGNNAIEALKISSGKRQWRHRASSSPRNLVVGSGVVVNGSQVLDAKSGKFKYYLPEPTGETSNDPFTLVVGGRLYRNTNAEVGAWTVAGKPLWLYTKTGDHFEGPGEGESLVQYHAGRIYVREATADEKPTLVLDADTGVQLGELPFTAQPLAFDGPVGIFTQKHWSDNDRVSLLAVDLDDAHVYWTKTYVAQNPQARMSLLTPPVIENGLVWFNLDNPAGGRSDLVAVDEVTGQQQSSTSLACRLKSHHSDGAAFGTIGVAQHRLFVPSTCGLQTFTAR